MWNEAEIKGYNKAIDDFEVNLKEAIGYIAFNPTDEELFIEYTAEFLRRNYVANNTRQKNNWNLRQQQI